MLDDILRAGFRLAHRRLGLIFLDLLWKAIWLVLTLAGLLLVAVWFGSELRSIAWTDAGSRAINAAVGLALLRQFWAAHQAAMFGGVATALFFSLLVWFLLEAAFRARLYSPPRTGGVAPPPLLCEEGNITFSTFLLSNVLKCLVVTTASVALATICFGRYPRTPISEWSRLWPDTRGAVFIALITVTALGFLLTIIDTLVRSDAIELLGTDLFRVAGLIGILLLFEAMITGSCAAMVAVGFLNVAGWKNALLMLGTASVAIVFVNVLHSYLFLVRFSAVGIMRQNVVEI